MNSFLDLDNSDFSKIMIYLLENKGVKTCISDLSIFTGVNYNITKIIIKRLFRFGMLRRNVKSGHPSFDIDMNSKIVKKFILYYKLVIETEI